jgi:YesN/AraC family two-component response regulator
LLSCLIETQGVTPDASGEFEGTRIYIKTVIDYVAANYSRKLKISDIAKYVGLNQTYLGMLFKEQLDITLQQYVMRFRVEKACQLMANRQLSIREISSAVGYEDSLLFSKVFKKVKQVAPSDYRNSLEGQA